MSAKLFLVAAPSGAGKTSLVKALAETDDRIEVSISYTTRPRRPGEADGRHYHFVDEATFAAMRDADAFLEHARKFGHGYATARAQVEDALRRGRDVVLEIDWQGAAQVRTAFADAIGIFILPPSKAALRARLMARGQDDAEIIADRMRQAREEIAHYAEFDHLIVNDDFDQALREFTQVVAAARHGRATTSRPPPPVLKELLGCADAPNR